MIPETKKLGQDCRPAEPRFHQSREDMKMNEKTNNTAAAGNPVLSRRMTLGLLAAVALPAAEVSARGITRAEPLQERRTRLIAELNEVLAEETGMSWKIYDSPKNGVLTFMDVGERFEDNRKPKNLSEAGYEVSWRLFKEVL